MIQCKELFPCDTPFQSDSVCCINVPVVLGMFFHAAVEREEWDFARRSRARLGGCTVLSWLLSSCFRSRFWAADSPQQMDFCWSWKTNLRGSEIHVATFLEAPLHAPSLRSELSCWIFSNSFSSNQTGLGCEPGSVLGLNGILSTSQVVFSAETDPAWEGCRLLSLPFTREAEAEIF